MRIGRAVRTLVFFEVVETVFRFFFTKWVLTYIVSFDWWLAGAARESFLRISLRKAGRNLPRGKPLPPWLTCGSGGYVRGRVSGSALGPRPRPSRPGWWLADFCS